MYIPNPSGLVTAALALASTGTLSSKPSKIISGQVLDYAVHKCLDGDGEQRCTRAFPVVADVCYYIKWSTDGALSHTTVEVRDVGSSEIVYYRDTNGEWEAEKNELVYMDFKPKIYGQGNKTVDFEVRECEDQGESLRAEGELK